MLPADGITGHTRPAGLELGERHADVSWLGDGEPGIRGRP